VRGAGTSSTLRELREVLQKLVLIPLVCLAALITAVLYVIGGRDLLMFALNQISLKTVGGIATFAVFVSFRHFAWYRNEPSPMWWRRSAWVNSIEILILLALVVLAFWAIPRFA